MLCLIASRLASFCESDIAKVAKCVQAKVIKCLATMVESEQDVVAEYAYKALQSILDHTDKILVKGFPEHLKQLEKRYAERINIK